MSTNSPPPTPLSEIKRNVFIFAPKSPLHEARANLYGRVMSEGQLMTSLMLENTQHPFASKEAINALVRTAHGC